MKPTLHRLVAIALSALALVSCSTDAPTAVPHLQQSPPQEASQDLLSLSSLLGVNGLQRTRALAAPITVAELIGPNGGTLTIPEAGVTVTVPRGALAASTKITMTARAGSLVAYDFAPHGITFAKPLVFSQKLSGTNATLLSAPLLRLGYYSDANLLTKSGGLVSELLGGVVNALSWTFTSKIPHFSGYMVSCGRR
jgi:ZU5 domain-containing protein